MCAGPARSVALRVTQRRSADSGDTVHTACQGSAVPSALSHSPTHSVTGECPFRSIPHTHSTTHSVTGECPCLRRFNNRVGNVLGVTIATPCPEGDADASTCANSRAAQHARRLPGQHARLAACAARAPACAARAPACTDARTRTRGNRRRQCTIAWVLARKFRKTTRVLAGLQCRAGSLCVTHPGVVRHCSCRCRKEPLIDRKAITYGEVLQPSDMYGYYIGHENSWPHISGAFSKDFSNITISTYSEPGAALHAIVSLVSLPCMHDIHIHHATAATRPEPTLRA